MSQLFILSVFAGKIGRTRQAPGGRRACRRVGRWRRRRRGKSFGWNPTSVQQLLKFQPESTFYSFSPSSFVYFFARHIPWKLRLLIVLPLAYTNDCIQQKNYYGKAKVRLRLAMVSILPTIVSLLMSGRWIFWILKSGCNLHVMNQIFDFLRRSYSGFFSNFYGCISWPPLRRTSFIPSFHYFPWHLEILKWWFSTKGPGRSEPTTSGSSGKRAHHHGSHIKLNFKCSMYISDAMLRWRIVLSSIKSKFKIKVLNNFQAFEHWKRCLFKPVYFDAQNLSKRFLKKLY